MQVWQRDNWVGQTLHPAEGIFWRAVEAQHLVATMRLVDTLEEQELLERILEASKPVVPESAKALHYLLFTPFRYPSPQPSRFRRADAPGIWYGASDVRGACAEAGYWRWRFLVESQGLRDTELITEHTFFQAKVAGRCLDLSSQPWAKLKRRWSNKSDYSSCHVLAEQARVQGVQWIAYPSVRSPESACAAVFDAIALILRQPNRQESWAAKVNAKNVIFVRDRQGFLFEAGAWV